MDIMRETMSSPRASSSTSSGSRSPRGCCGPLLDWVARNGGTVDVQDMLKFIVFNTICSVAFDKDPTCVAAESRVHACLQRRAEPWPSSCRRSSYCGAPSGCSMCSLASMNSKQRLRGAASAVANEGHRHRGKRARLVAPAGGLPEICGAVGFDGKPRANSFLFGPMPREPVDCRRSDVRGSAGPCIATGIWKAVAGDVDGSDVARPTGKLDIYRIWS
ncbi:hypothetical protein ACP4OV_008633 [Aristida adscensionis]